MKRIKLLVIISFLLLILVGCDLNSQGENDVKSHYDVNVIDEHNLITSPLNELYEINTEIRFTVYVLTGDYYVEVYLNNEMLEPSSIITDAMVDCPYAYYEYTFTITDNVTLEIKKIIIEDEQHSHVWDEGQICSLPIMSDTSNFIYYTCTICGTESIYTNNNKQKYTVTLQESIEQYLLNEIEDEYEEGTIVTINTELIDDSDILLYVNNEKVYGYIGIDHKEFKFIMPSEDVEISVTIINLEGKFYPEDVVELKILKPWLNEIELEDIDVIKTKGYDIEQEPGTFTNIKYSNDPTDIEKFYALKDFVTYPVIPLYNRLTGYYQEITIYLKNGAKYKIELINEVMNIDGRYYCMPSTDRFSSTKLPLQVIPQIFNPYLECHSIVTPILDNPKFYVNYEYVGIIKNLGEVEFIPIQYVETDSTDKPFMIITIDTDYCNIRMEDSTIFMYGLSGELKPIKYYHIVQGMDDAPAGFYGITINPVA